MCLGAQSEFRISLFAFLNPFRSILLDLLLYITWRFISQSSVSRPISTIQKQNTVRSPVIFGIASSSVYFIALTPTLKRRLMQYAALAQRLRHLRNPIPRATAGVLIALALHSTTKHFFDIKSSTPMFLRSFPGIVCAGIIDHYCGGFHFRITQTRLLLSFEWDHFAPYSVVVNS
jgi:hypothetical protein